MHTHTLYTHIHTQIRYPCVVKWWFAHVQTSFSQIFPPYPPQTLAAFHYRFLSSTPLSIDKKKIIGLKLGFKHFVTKNAFFAWKSTFQGGCLFRMKGHKCSECRIPSPQSPCWSTCAMVIPCLWFFMIWGCTSAGHSICRVLIFKIYFRVGTNRGKDGRHWMSLELHLIDAAFLNDELYRPPEENSENVVC